MATSVVFVSIVVYGTEFLNDYKFYRGTGLDFDARRISIDYEKFIRVHITL